VTPEPFVPHHLAGTPYRLDAVLGEGAMGEVYLGEHVDLRRPAVIKLIRAKFVKEEQVVGRMRREARIVARIRHEALVTIYDLGVAADGRTFIAMEYLEGSVLRRILQQRAPLPVLEATRLMAMACDGLDVAHKAGVIHRDVKPENLFVTEAGQLKVLDFGVAKPMHEGELTSARTAVGIVLGTPRYMAPEQAMGRALSPATDVYAVGCVLHELLTGLPIFDARDARELLYHHVHAPVASLSARTGHPFDPRLEAIVARALAKDPTARFAAAADLAAALRALDPRASTPPAVGFLERPTVRLDDKPTVASTPPPSRLSAAPAHGADASTVRVDPNHRSFAPAAEHAATTRPVSASALIDGSSTTAHGAAFAQTLAAPALDPPRSAAPKTGLGTVATEVLSEPQNATGDLAAEVSTGPSERRKPSPVWPFVAGGIVLLGAATAAIVAFGPVGKRNVAEPAKVESPASGATSAVAPTLDPQEPSAPDPQTAAVSTAAVTGPSEVASAGPSAESLARRPGAKPRPSATASAAASMAEPTPPEPPPGTSLLAQAKAHLASGDLDAAEREARQSIPTHGNEARVVLAQALEKKGKLDSARREYERVLESDPNHPTAKARISRLPR
jgi:serine/threonine-protein kinase